MIFLPQKQEVIIKSQGDSIKKMKMICYNRSMKIEELKAKLAKIEDPQRTDRGNIRHKLEDIIIIGLCTQICDGNDFADMEEFGIQRRELLHRFLELPNGIPDSDTFRRVFEQLNPEALSECLYDWLSCNRKEDSGRRSGLCDCAEGEPVRFAGKRLLIF